MWKRHCFNISKHASHCRFITQTSSWAWHFCPVHRGWGHTQEDENKQEEEVWHHSSSIWIWQGMATDWLIFTIVAALKVYSGIAGPLGTVGTHTQSFFGGNFYDFFCFVPRPGLEIVSPNQILIASVAPNIYHGWWPLLCWIMIVLSQCSIWLLQAQAWKNDPKVVVS